MGCHIFCLRERACKICLLYSSRTLPIIRTNFLYISDECVSFLFHRWILRILSWYALSFFWTDMLCFYQVWLRISSVAAIVAWTGLLELVSLMLDVVFAHKNKLTMICLFYLWKPCDRLVGKSSSWDAAHPGSSLGAGRSCEYHKMVAWTGLSVNMFSPWLSFLMLILSI